MAAKPESEEKVTRDKLVGFYLSAHDAAFLRKAAHDGGFKSTSHLLSAIIEPIIHRQLSIHGFVSSALRICKFMESTGNVKFAVDSSSLKGLFGFTPPPPAIPEEPISIEKLRSDLATLVDLLEEEQSEVKPPRKSKTK